MPGIFFESFKKLEIFFQIELAEDGTKELLLIILPGRSGGHGFHGEGGFRERWNGQMPVYMFTEGLIA